MAETTWGPGGSGLGTEQLSLPTCPVVDDKEVRGCLQELVGHHGIAALISIQS